MKTSDILLLDLRKEENKKKVNKFLLKIKFIGKAMEGTSNRLVPIEVLEDFLKEIKKRYGYGFQMIYSYYEDDIFRFYHVGIVNGKSEWIGNVEGVTMWELFAKGTIKIYADIKRNEV